MAPSHSRSVNRYGHGPLVCKFPINVTVPWQGTTHQVTVLADGYGWNGQHHASLSGIAHAITGTKWNGPRFFGLREVGHAV